MTPVSLKDTNVDDPHNQGQAHPRIRAGHTFKGFPPDILSRAQRKFAQLDAATGLFSDLLAPPSNRLEALKGDRLGQWSNRINEQWRLCFRFDGGDDHDVEIVDYR